MYDLDIVSSNLLFMVAKLIINVLWLKLERCLIENNTLSFVIIYSK